MSPCSEQWECQNLHKLRDPVAVLVIMAETVVSLALIRRAAQVIVAKHSIDPVALTMAEATTMTRVPMLKRTRIGQLPSLM